MIAETAMVCVTALVLGTYRFVTGVHKREVEADERFYKMEHPDREAPHIEARKRVIHVKREILNEQRSSCFSKVQGGFRYAEGKNWERVQEIDKELLKLAEEEAELG